MPDRPWLAAYPPDVPTSLEPYPDDSLFAMLAQAASRHPRRPAISFLGSTMTYSALMGEVERFSAVLAEVGVGAGDRVGLLLPNCPQYAIALFAAVRIGAIPVGANPLSTEREIAAQLSDAGVTVTVVLDQLYERIDGGRGAVEAGTIIATKLTEYMRPPASVVAPLKLRRDAQRDGRPWPPQLPRAVRRWASCMRSAGAVPGAASFDAEIHPAALVYTGGTTGGAKAATLSHRNLVANATQAASWFPQMTDGRDAMMCVLPFFHSFGMLAMNVGVLRAMKLILVPRFEIRMVLRQIARERPTYLPGVPRMYIAINEAPESRRYDLRSIQACISGAAPLPLAVAERFKELTGGAELVEGYGLTECSPVTHANPLSGRRKDGSIGLPLPDTDCRIVDVDDAARAQPPGTPGELCIRGPQVMLGYWNRPEETKAAIHDGWLRTGDIAVMDEEGYFSIVDRLKDVVIVSGFNVYPTEVEDVLYRHPKVQKASVIGVPDERTGEALKAFIVLRPGETASPEEIVAWMRDPVNGLTGYRVPKQVEFREELPETLVGKVLRRELQRQDDARRQDAASSNP